MAKLKEKDALIAKLLDLHHDSDSLIASVYIQQSGSDLVDLDLWSQSGHRCHYLLSVQVLSWQALSCVSDMTEC